MPCAPTRNARAPITTISAEAAGWVAGAGSADVAFSYVLNTGGRQVSAADLRSQELLAGALASYPDSPDPLRLLPRPARDG